MTLNAPIQFVERTEYVSAVHERRRRTDTKLFEKTEEFPLLLCSLCMPTSQTVLISPLSDRGG